MSAPMPRPLEGFSAVNRYWGNTRSAFSAKILPGEYYLIRNDEYITTVLGSCVAACIWDPFSRVGGTNHFMLPEDTSESGRWSGTEARRACNRYGTFAMESLVNEVLTHGGLRSHLRAKVSGGGRVLRNVSDIGERNIRFVRQFLDAEGIFLLGEDLGGPWPRKVVFYPLTGKAYVKRLRHLHNQTILMRERQYLRDIDQKPVQGSMEWF